MSLASLLDEAIKKRHGRPRKYTQADFDRMEKMQQEGKSFDEIGLAFGVKGCTIRNKFYEHIGAVSDKHLNGTTDKPLKAPDFSGWDFSDNAA